MPKKEKKKKTQATIIRYLLEQLNIKRLTKSSISKNMEQLELPDIQNGTTTLQNWWVGFYNVKHSLAICLAIQHLGIYPK